MIRLLSVDDHRMMHRAIAYMVAQRPDLQLVGEATSGEEALEFIEALQPHLVLMDLDMPGMGGITATERIRKQYPQVRIIIVSGQTQEPYPSRALAAGAMGFLSKDCDQAEMERAIRRVLQGHKHIAADVAGNMALRLMGKTQASPFDVLSDRELAVARLICIGRNTTQIAEVLEIHANTVSSFRRRIYDKVEVRNDVELTLAAIRHGLIRIDST